jgi:hypothetical protein
MDPRLGGTTGFSVFPFELNSHTENNFCKKFESNIFKLYLMITLIARALVRTVARKKILVLQYTEKANS